MTWNSGPSLGGPDDPGTPDLDPLAPYRERWQIMSCRDEIAVVSALRRPTSSSLIYIVGYSAEDLAAKLADAERRDRGEES